MHKSSFLLLVLGLLVLFVMSAQGRIVLADTTSSVLPERYSATELEQKNKGQLLDMLAGLSKQELIAVLLQQNANLSNGTVPTLSDDKAESAEVPTEKPMPVSVARRQHGLLPIIGLVAGSLIVATALHAGPHAISPGSASTAEALRARTQAIAIRPLITSATNASCNENVQFSCGPYPLHQTTCSFLSGLTTAEAAVFPLFVRTTSTQTQTIPSADMPQVGATVESQDKTNSTTTISVQKPVNGASETQIAGAVTGAAVHLLQIGAQCTNGTPAVAGGS